MATKVKYLCKFDFDISNRHMNWKKSKFRYILYLLYQLILCRARSMIKLWYKQVRQVKISNALPRDMDTYNSSLMIESEYKVEDSRGICSFVRCNLNCFWRVYFIIFSFGLLLNSSLSIQIPIQMFWYLLKVEVGVLHLNFHEYQNIGRFFSGLLKNNILSLIIYFCFWFIELNNNLSLFIFVLKFIDVEVFKKNLYYKPPI